MDAIAIIIMIVVIIIIIIIIYYSTKVESIEKKVSPTEVYLKYIGTLKYKNNNNLYLTIDNDLRMELSQQKYEFILRESDSVELVADYMLIYGKNEEDDNCKLIRQRGGISFVTFDDRSKYLELQREE